MKRKISAFLAVVLAISACAALMAIPTTAETVIVNISENGGYLWGVPENCTVAQLSSLYHPRPYIVVNEKGVQLTGSQLVGTNCKIRYEVEIGLYEELDIVIRGDTNGDGKINATDYLMIKTHIRGEEKLKDARFHAADINGDKYVTTVDYLNVKAYFFGNYDIYLNAPIIPNESKDSSSSDDSDASWTSNWV